MATITPMKAIRLKCLECCCGQRSEVRLCHIKDCALWQYRFGHRPRNTGDSTGFEGVQDEDEEDIMMGKKSAECPPASALEGVTAIE